MTLTGKRLMILGAGASQLPVIDRAVALGCQTITVDNIPHNVGHRRSHESVDVSTTDVEGVVRAARRLRIDGVVTFASDVATLALAAVCQDLGLPGPAPEAARILSTKTEFRSHLHERHGGLPCVAAETRAQALAALDRWTGPVVVKPADSSGSRGVARVDPLDPDGLAAAFDRARAVSRTGAVCLEPWIDGVHTSGDGFLLDGRFAAVTVTEKYRDGFVSTGHSIPTSLPGPVVERLAALVERYCLSVGYASGPVDFDAIIPAPGSSAPDPVVVEMSPRLGGNGIPQLVDRAGRGDLIAANITWALGRRPVWSAAGPVRPCGSLVFGSPQAGRLARMARCEDLSQTIPGVFAAECYYEIGQSVPAFEHGGNAMGIVLFDLGDEDYAAVSARVRRALAVEIVPDQE